MGRAIAESISCLLPEMAVATPKILHFSIFGHDVSLCGAHFYFCPSPKKGNWAFEFDQRRRPCLFGFFHQQSLMWEVNHVSGQAVFLLNSQAVSILSSPLPRFFILIIGATSYSHTEICLCKTPTSCNTIQPDSQPFMSH